MGTGIESEVMERMKEALKVGTLIDLCEDQIRYMFMCLNQIPIVTKLCKVVVCTPGKVFALIGSDGVPGGIWGHSKRKLQNESGNREREQKRKVRIQNTNGEGK